MNDEMLNNSRAAETESDIAALSRMRNVAYAAEGMELFHCASDALRRVVEA